MKKEEKLNSIDLAKSIFSDNSVVILLNYSKMDAKAMYLLRKDLKGKNANVKILKNTLVKRAIADTEMKDLIGDFKEQVAISYSNDPVSLSNVLIKFAEGNENLDVKIGFMDGKIMELSTIKSLSSLGSMDEVRAKFIGLLKAPGSQLARVLSAYETKLNENAGN